MLLAACCEGAVGAPGNRLAAGCPAGCLPPGLGSRARQGPPPAAPPVPAPTPPLPDAASWDSDAACVPSTTPQPVSPPRAAGAAKDSPSPRPVPGASAAQRLVQPLRQLVSAIAKGSSPGPSPSRHASSSTSHNGGKYAHDSTLHDDCSSGARGSSHSHGGRHAYSSTTHNGNGVRGGRGGRKYKGVGYADEKVRLRIACSRASHRTWRSCAVQAWILPCAGSRCKVPSTSCMCPTPHPPATRPPAPAQEWLVRDGRGNVKGPYAGQDLLQMLCDEKLPEGTWVSGPPCTGRAAGAAWLPAPPSGSLSALASLSWSF